MSKVVVAMSGGVDSSLAAALLKEQGYDVIGVTMDLFALLKDYCLDRSLKSCCGKGAIEDAHKVATSLQIPHYVVDLKETFEEKVVQDFCQEYAAGRTPNPCIRCNQFIKFETLLERASKLDAEYLATGHHARILFNEASRLYSLNKGKDEDKDQSYFLYTLTQSQLSRLLMPVGEFTKSEVRIKAAEFDLPVAQRPDSQEICFIPDNDYTNFLKSRMPEAFIPGDIVDPRGQVIGKHDGILHYTIGQRKGMGIAASHPLYVIDIQPDKNLIVAGPNDDLYKKKILAGSVHMISGEKLGQISAIQAKIRYKHEESSAELELLDDSQALVTFDTPQRAITPGQAVVFYDGDRIIGGGVIEKGIA
jgi:tRNA-specific 2-thiouridylase